ncbi:MAG: GNAT family N-acetyltransferase [candidate division Zixibacteria bacterium]|nr:GNAT family N-acetyltransferase [candidate division Zixibacteria bacterium]
MKQQGLMTEEITFKNFPFDNIPWALDNNGRFRTNAVKDTTTVLILYENNIPASYLCYDKRIDVVEIHYVQTELSSQEKGLATILMKEICKRYHKDFAIHALSTSTNASGLLKKCGFEQIREVEWILPKEKQTE